MDTRTPATVASLEELAQRKAELHKQLQAQTETMRRLAGQLVAPASPALTKAGVVARVFRTGMALFNGAMMGMRVVRIARTLFK